VEYLEFISGCFRNLLLYGYIETVSQRGLTSVCQAYMSSGVGVGIKGECVKVKFQMLQSREATCAPFPSYLCHIVYMCAHSVTMS
jgi:hypothetical protein